MGGIPINSGGCALSERTLTYGVKVKSPIVFVPDRGFKDCCYKNIVMAKLGSSRDWENDYNSFYFKRQLPNDTAAFKLVKGATEYPINDSTYGEFWALDSIVGNEDLTICRVDWQNVLDNHGEGTYRIKTEFSFAGQSYNRFSNTFHLIEFSNDLADKMVRIDSIMRGELVHFGINFKGLEYKTSTRLMGYFGNREPKYVQDNLVKRTYEAVQISMSQENIYQFQTGLIPICITEEIYDWHLFGDEIFINDYHKANHRYYLSIPVELDGNKGGKYYVNERHARINLTFKDRFKDKRKINCY